MAAYLSPIMNETCFNNGQPNAGGKVQVFNAGTTTPATLFTEISGLLPNTNPVILDARGIPIQPIWLPAGNYDFTLLDPNDLPLYHVYNVSGSNSTSGSGPAPVVTATEWLDSGLTAVFIDGNNFRVTGDTTSVLLVNRRFKIAYLTGFLYGTIKASVYAGGVTTVNVLNDGTGSLLAGIGEVYYGLLSPVNYSIPPYLFPTYANDILNGQFRIAQDGTIFNTPVSGTYDLDGWLSAYVCTATVRISQEIAPTISEFFRSTTVLTAQGAPTAGQFFCNETRMEGYDCAKYINTGFTLGFWVRSSVAGIHCVSIFNGTTSYVMEYNIPTANVVARIDLHVPSGTPTINNMDHNVGLIINWANLCGANYRTAAPNTWQTGVFKATANQVNDLATIGNVFSLVNVTMNLGGNVLHDFITFQADWDRCQRYFYKETYWITTTPMNITLPTTMRMRPTITGVGAGGVEEPDGNGGNIIGYQTTAAKQLLSFSARL